MTRRLENKVALVTGGGMGIGRSIAGAFAREGARVMIADIDDQAGQDTVSAICATGDAAFFARTDVADPASVDRLRDVLVATCGRLDVLVCCAAIYTRGDITQTDAETFERIMAVNLTGVFNCCKIAVPLMQQAGGGSIINITSSVGWHSTGLAVDHLRENIRVNGIAPGPTDTPLLRASRTPEALEAFKNAQPIGRLGQPDEIAAAAVFLASDEASFVTGIILPVDGGQTAHI
jgi:NAD(P)-dependent dehydrogenase (short-subunit alcohol dehydrogenase family)